MAEVAIVEAVGVGAVVVVEAAVSKPLWLSLLRALLTCLLYTACLAATAAGDPAGHQRVALMLGNTERQFLLHLPPAYDKSKALPLVVMLHGMGGTAANAVRETGWSAKADTVGFMVAYAEATRPDPARAQSIRNNAQAWNDGSGRFHAGERNVDDLAYLRAVIDRISSDYAVDKRRIYVTGFSNGASMTFRVGAELADRVAAIAPIAGASWLETLSPKQGLSICTITGTADPLNPLDGGMPRLAFRNRGEGGKAKRPVIAQIEQWAEVLKIAPTPSSDEARNGVRTRRYGPAASGEEIVFITVEGLGHIWAGGENLLPEMVVGKPTDKLNATNVVWDFFQTHPKR
jgi:polyhydroxybutyrate depolymerase